MFFLDQPQIPQTPAQGQRETCYQNRDFTQRPEGVKEQNTLHFNPHTLHINLANLLPT